MLNSEQQAQWQEAGYLALPNFKPAAELQAAVARAHALVEKMDPSQHSSTRFSTRDRSLVADAALLASAHTVQCFFEEEAFDDSGLLRVSKTQSINKIGHALHVLDPVYRAFSTGPALATLAADLGLQQPQVRQSQIIFKQPRIGGEVGWHQDASFFVTTPHSVVTFWFALEDATLENGCLWVEPGGHRGPRGVLREKYSCEQGQLRMLPLNGTPWPDAQQARALPVPAGTLLCFGGLLPHFSAANRSPHSRLAYTLHITDGRCTYAPQNWLQPLPGQPLPGLD